MTPQYRQYLIDRYEEEVEGEAFFRGLSQRTADDERKRKWSVLAQLESETAAHLRAALKDVGVETTALPERVARGRKQAEQLSGMPWSEQLGMLRPALEKFIAQFQAAERITPEGSRERALMRHVTRHEQALLAFTAGEMEGRGETSLDAVLALLGSPIDRT